MIHNLVTGAQTGLGAASRPHFLRKLNREQLISDLWPQDYKTIFEYCSQAILCMYFITRRMKNLSYDVFLTLLPSLFVSNPPVSRWQYYTAESIFEGIEAIKAFIYPHLEHTPQKTPPHNTDGDTFNRQPAKGSPVPSPGRIFYLYSFIKKSYSLSLCIEHYCGRCLGGNRLPRAAAANGGKASRKIGNETSGCQIRFRL